MSAEKGSCFGAFHTAWNYEKGKGVEKNVTKASEWYKKALQNGLAAAKQ